MELGGIDLEGTEGGGEDFDGLRGSCEGEFVGATAVDGPGPGASEELEGLGVGGELVFGKDADELELRFGRIEEGAEEVEDGGEPFFCEELASGGDGAEGGVVGGGEEESEAEAQDALAEVVRREVDGDAEGLEDIGAAALGSDGAVAMFKDNDAARCEDEHGGGGDVEEFESVATGAADVEGGAWEGGVRDLGVDGEREEGGGEVRDFVGGFALLAEGLEEVRLRGGGVVWVREPGNGELDLLCG
ncbi:MAG: hypothetical protein RLZZ244_2131 [Verrucomicrobiota bacterium]